MLYIICCFYQKVPGNNFGGNFPGQFGTNQSSNQSLSSDMCRLLLWGLFCLILSNVGEAEDPIIRTPKGLMKGTIIKSLLGQDIYSFRGIRYGKAPVGELRFQPPVPTDNWNDIYNATADPPACPQPGIEPISEDCLFLNVYSTKLPHKHYSPLRSVLFFIHSGGFYSVTARSDLIGPQYLLDQDVVLVVINYRLATLGFLSTGDKLAPGNNGLKDQVLALKWVKKNILAFGGNPNSVTIIGYSAGGTSVTAHMLSPMSRGLFHNAVAMSGSIFSQWPLANHQFHLAQKQARLVGCPDDTSQNIVKCLKNVSAKTLGNSFFGFAEFGSDPVLIWTPVIELDFGQERFLTEHPIKSVLNDDFVKVPFMGGVTTEEFSYLARNILGNPRLLHEMNYEFNRVAPISFVYERDTPKSNSISAAFRKTFLGDGLIDNSSFTGLGQLYADSLGAFGVNRAVKLISARNTNPTYYYRFSFKGRYSHVYLPNSTIPYGTVHHDDLIYLFYISVLVPKFNITDPEYAMVRKLSTLLRNFAYTGNPTPYRMRELDYILWTPYLHYRNNKYMDIGNNLKMKKNLYEDRYSVWEKQFPLSDYMN